MELRMAGRRWEEIRDALGYRTYTAAIMAVQALLDRTAKEPAERFRTLTLERLTKVVQVFYPAMVSGDERAGMMVLRAVADIRQLLGLDAPVKVQVDIREEVARIAKDLNLNEAEVLAEAEKILGR